MRLASQQLMFETQNHLRIGGELRKKYLDGDDAAEIAVSRFIDAAHAAFAKKFVDLETRAKLVAWLQHARTAAAATA